MTDQPQFAEQARHLGKAIVSLSAALPAVRVMASQSRQTCVPNSAAASYAAPVTARHAAPVTVRAGK